MEKKNPVDDPDATIEFDVIERPLTEVEEELAITLDPDQISKEGLDRAIQQWGMGI